jgi:hypothetical protein
VALDEDPSGWFWDSGVSAVAYHGGDHWSPFSLFEQYVGMDLEAGVVFPPTPIILQCEKSEQ